MTPSDWITTHDSARELLRYCALGATVVIEPLRSAHRRPEARSFTLVLDGAAGHAVNAADAYVLPCLALPLASRVKALCDAASRALAHKRKGA